MNSNRQEGFTLIELMIVVAVVAILAAVAYPSYTTSILKGKRAQARTALLDLLQQQERYMTQRNCYLAFTNTGGTIALAANTTCGVAAATSVPFKTYAGESATNPPYYLSAGTCSTGAIDECVRVTATPTFTDTAVGALSITSTGVKACTGTASGTANANLCWP
ncbi:MAG: Tfp pilus assembly protein PilE [Rhodoferax sp.]|nr:Tfp pilus assembly protein PilE [Rhodoferax sp.]